MYTLEIHFQHMQAITSVSIHEPACFDLIGTSLKGFFQHFANGCNVEFSSKMSSTEEDGVRDY